MLTYIPSIWPLVFRKDRIKLYLYTRFSHDVVTTANSNHVILGIMEIYCIDELTIIMYQNRRNDNKRKAAIVIYQYMCIRNRLLSSDSIILWWTLPSGYTRFENIIMIYFSWNENRKNAVVGLYQGQLDPTSKRLQILIDCRNEEINILVTLVRERVPGMSVWNWYIQEQ